MKDNVNSTFSLDGKILSLEVINVPRMFQFTSEAKAYLLRYVENNPDFNYNYNFTDVTFIKDGEA